MLTYFITIPVVSVIEAKIIIELISICNAMINDNKPNMKGAYGLTKCVW